MNQVINKHFTTKPDDYLQKILGNEVKVMDMHVEDISIDFKKTWINLIMKLIFFVSTIIFFMILFKKQYYKKNYSGDEENKCYYDPWEELKIDVEFLCEYVYWK